MNGPPQLRMTDAEVANNFAAVLEKLKHGAEVVVERNHRPVAVISPVRGPGRPIDECIALAKAHGSGAKLDEEYAADLEEIIASERKGLFAADPLAAIRDSLGPESIARSG